MGIQRRDFLKTSIITGTFAGFSLQELLASNRFSPSDLFESGAINIPKPKGRNYWKPLEDVFLKLDHPKAATIHIWDGRGNNYASFDYSDAVNFTVGGALGYHKVTLHDATNGVLDGAVFPVDCQTELKDDDNEFHEFFDILYQTLFSSSYSHGKTVRYNNKYYKYYSSWFQDHVFVAEGMKYFTDDVKTGIDLYADGQRKDGLIWDNYKHPYPEMESFWEYRFNYGGFTYRPEDPQSSAIFVRIPVENIGEHTFLEGLYYAWKATGDDEWMKGKLNHALKAVEFVTSSPYYWSEEKKLLKRPFSIDRWDFQSDFDAKITGKDFMGADLEKTHYGIMFGDNICLANGCKWLSEMLQHAGRTEEAEKMANVSREIWERINSLSWNGQFYTHWVSLETNRNLDFGIDTSTQVTLSNAMALIRGLEPEKAKAIIRTYQGIKKDMPETSPGEWYMCYPPFEKGWHINKWEYMNGGVSPILAGDLALGAFENGYEKYGIDIMRRLHKLAIRSDYKLRGCYKGKMITAPERNFTVIDLKNWLNADINASKNSNLPVLGNEEADLRNVPTGKQTFEGVPFYIADPNENHRKSCLIVSRREGLDPKVTVPVQQHAKSLYLLHTADTNNIAGIFKIHYNDNSYDSRYIQSSREIDHFWYPKMTKTRKGIPNTVVAWKGPAQVVGEVGIYAYGMNNPHPEKKISHFEFLNDQDSNWAIFGITLSDGEHFFEPSIVSTIPDHWAAAHVFKALMEGLVGIKNTGVAFNQVLLSPKWELADVKKVKATAKFVPSGGYLSYIYEKLSENQLIVEFSSNAPNVRLQLPLPSDKTVQLVKVNQTNVNFTTSTPETTRYLQVDIHEPGPQKMIVHLV